MSIFTKIYNNEVPGHIVYEDNKVFALLDAYPKSTAHTLVIPKAEIENLYLMPDDIGGHIFNVVKKISIVIKDTFGADGIKIIQNNGTSAGQAVMHFHIHIIPFYGEEKSNFDKNNFSSIAKLIKKSLL